MRRSFNEMTMALLQYSRNYYLYHRLIITFICTVYPKIPFARFNIVRKTKSVILSDIGSQDRRQTKNRLQARIAPYPILRLVKY